MLLILRTNILKYSPQYILTSLSSNFFFSARARCRDERLTGAAESSLTLDLFCCMAFAFSISCFALDLFLEVEFIC